MNAIDGTNRRSRGVGKPALLHTSGSSVIADNSRGDYASNQIFENDGPLTPVPDKAHRAASKSGLTDRRSFNPRRRPYRCP
jgi:hypothetical protein